MEAIQYLKQIRVIDTLVKNKNRLIAELHAKMFRITPSYEGERVQSTLDPGRRANTMVLIADLERELDFDNAELLNKKREIMKVIDQLENASQIELLYKRYVYLKGWETIAREMHYSRDGVFKIHRQALKKVQQILDETIY